MFDCEADFFVILIHLKIDGLNSMYVVIQFYLMSVKQTTEVYCYDYSNKIHTILSTDYRNRKSSIEYQ